MATNESIKEMFQKGEHLAKNGYLSICWRKNFDNELPGYEIFERDDNYIILSTKGDEITLTGKDIFKIETELLFKGPEDYSEAHNKLSEIMDRETLYGYLGKNVVFSKYQEFMKMDKIESARFTMELIGLEGLERMFGPKFIPKLTKGICGGIEDLEDNLLKTMISQIEEREKFMKNVKKR